ncbi:hypothetical protein IQ215_03260 [Cyanobacterium stanieri LEGE 03274]|uniref:Uncharacterized protein n=1 Tax=Cyanobacterium stanieri LEGE 03274 TaxID=1828756 RepID=A0ABR9V3J5_9CHRO|nr:hypothetical protein [Cyanobacterium stanieri]MBE9221706.1 hypothetical protein [Cyanobacterium stanieri LEGE 03274]
MERGLFWLPLLILFFWLAWSGKNEYQKLENYKVWAENFDKSKYDIYAVLGKKGNLITWGKPTAKGIINTITFSLDDIVQINLVDKNQVALDSNLSEKQEANIQFITQENQSIIVPFTQGTMAQEWCKYLQKFKNNIP